MSDVLTESRGEVAWIYLNRPDRLNAFDLEMARELRAAIEDAVDAGVIVLSGKGRGFSAGGYLGSLAEPDPAQLRGLFSASLHLLDAVRLSPRPVIAAVNGVAAGGGNELVIACDFALAAESASFGQTGPKVGSAPVFGGTNLLSILVGERRAKEISMLCRRYSAARALEWGLVNAVVPDGELEGATTEWAEELLAMSPRYLEIAKVSSNAWWSACRDSYLSGMEMLVQAAEADDVAEGARAFLEKRPPRWPGRAP